MLQVWGNNIEEFIATSERLGYTISSMTADSIADKQKDDNLSVFVEFGVFSDEGQELELRFEHYFESISTSGRANLEDYETIINNQDVLIYCKNTIQNLDSYFLENGSYYTLRILKIDDFDLNFLWEIDYEDVDDDELPVDNLKDFFKIESNDELLDEIEDITSEFNQDTMTSLEYINNF